MQRARDPLPGVVGALPRPGARRTASRSSAPTRPPRRPGVADAIATADVVLLAPSNPVVSIGAILAVPGIRGALRSTPAPVIGYSPIIARKAVARHGRRVPVGDRRGQHVGGGRRLLRRRARGTGILDGWLVHEGDHAEIDGRRRCGRCPLLMTDPAATAEMVRAGLDLGGVSTARDRPRHGRGRDRDPARCPGCPSSGPGDDLAAALAAAAPWLRDGDVVVVTSKVLSKCEGRIVPAPEDPEERDALRRKLIDAEAVRVLARKGRTLITENASRPGAGRRRRRRLQRRRHRTRAAAGRPRRQRRRAARRPARAARRHRRRGRHRHHGPGLAQRPDRRRHRRGRADGAARLRRRRTTCTATNCVVTEVAVADEIAAAADLVKGKLTGIPVAVVRGLTLRRRRIQRAARCCGPARRTCSGWAPRRRSRWAAARRSCCAGRCGGSARDPVAPELIEAAVAEALTAPAPHHTRPVRFVWLRRHRGQDRGCWTG